MNIKNIFHVCPACAAVLLLLITITVSVSCGIPAGSEQQLDVNPAVSGTVSSDSGSSDTRQPVEDLSETIGTVTSPDSPCAGGHTYEEDTHRDPTCFHEGTVVYRCTVCNRLSDEEIIPPYAHEFINGFCTRCGLNEGAETRFTYKFNSETQTYMLSMPRNDMPGEDWGMKETVILPLVGDDGIHGIRPVSGFFGIFYNNIFIRTVIIPEGYTMVGSNAFDHAVNIESIEFPSTITVIGDSAFNSDYKIRQIVLPDGLTTIGRNAFSDCTGLEDIQLPSTVTSIGAGAFRNTSLRSITLPDGMSAVSASLFSACRNLTQVVLPDTVTYIGNSAFEGTAIEQLDIPAGVTHIGQHAFNQCAIRRVVIPEGIEYFPLAFHQCPYLEEVVLPDSLTTLAQGQFSNCPLLRSINTPIQLKSFDYTTFRNCPSLTEITIDADHPTLGFRDGLLYSKTDGTLFRVMSYVTELIIPDDGSITAIGPFACQGHAGLTHVVIPGCVKTIDCSAFADCKKLSSVEIGEGVRLFDNWCFSGCTSLTSFTFPASAFTVNAQVLWNCYNLREVSIPKTFDIQYSSYRHSDLFEGCKSLERVYYGGTLDRWMSKVNPFSLETLSNPAGDYVVYCVDGEYDHHSSEKYENKH